MVAWGRQRAGIGRLEHAQLDRRADGRHLAGAHLAEEQQRTEQSYRLQAALAAEKGYTYVPPYDHPLIIAGQGTVAVEAGGSALVNEGSRLTRTIAFTDEDGAEITQSALGGLAALAR